MPRTAKFAPHEERIAQSFGLTPSMLTIIFRAKARKGHALGLGMGHEVASRAALVNRGLIFDDFLTERAYQIADEARRLGW